MFACFKSANLLQEERKKKPSKGLLLHFFILSLVFTIYFPVPPHCQQSSVFFSSTVFQATGPFQKDEKQLCRAESISALLE